ncbi:bifunctional diguanylate cyclase/phosphodiesterase [Planococcus versutus]|uniref:Bifunctional diguanylate cyclase/phosphodiesterase n=1 Tax=Planococcus versutus TaxID=1302659 RepID=A0A1B1RX50_9BACL|nr:bifunctional diguanylate cyclase/phosphodiesterase [Planococcus versutus]
MKVLPLSYDLTLIFFSIAVVLISSFIALTISGTLYKTVGKARLKWIVFGAFVMGLGIWSMHFIGMLASHLSVTITYSTPLVIVSILPALFASGLAFAIISRPQVRKHEIITGSVLISSGIIAMHYIGMAAMKMQATIEYDLFLWVLSVVIALVASLLAMVLLVYSRNRQGYFWLKMTSAIFITMGVSGMHYVGMAAARFTASNHHVLVSSNSISSVYIAYNVGLGMVLILLIAVLSLRSDNKVKSILDEYNLQFHSVIESATDGIVVTDANRGILQWNQGAQSLFGYTKDEVEHKDVQLIFPEAYPNFHLKKTVIASEKTIEMVGRKKDGNQFPVELSSGSWETPHGNYYSLIIRDITERRKSEKKIRDLVYLDSLTGLPNRRLFNDRLETAIEQSKENQSVLTVFYLDLDQFKLVNDTFGHQIGDQLLIDVATRIKTCIGKTDTLARLGGDEFVLLLPNTEYAAAKIIGEHILKELNQEFFLNDETIFITPSIGASLFPADGTESEQLMKNADIAMYRVKEEGKNSLQFFTFEMNELISRKSKIAMSIRKGLELGEFSVHYQPQIDIETEKIIGVEALVRWNHSKLGVISPAEFIPIAEENGMILYIGEFVLRTACQQNKNWQDAGVEPFRVAVNMSAKQFSQSNIAEVITRALKDADLAPEFLELELTESIIQKATAAISKMHELKKMGIHLSIDDFGTGYSSLSYLKLFPIDTLKIDQHFTRNIHSDAKDAALVDTIIQMARNLELNVIAEGVETVEQLAFLKNKRCHQAQGYYFHKPLMPEQIEELYLKI